MKILLVQPPPRQPAYETIVVPPLGLAYLAAVLRQAGHDVAIIDGFAMQMTWDEYERHLADLRPELVGVTAMTPVCDTSYRAIKLARPHCKTLVIGGAHVAAVKQQVFDDAPEIDYAMYGECERSFVDVVAALAEGRDVGDMPGVITREKINPPAELIADLDSLPFPARDLLPAARYRYLLSKGRGVTSMFTSRGCPYQCVFCDKSTFASKWRARSADNILAEMREIVQKHGIRSIIVYDDLFTVDVKRVKAVCKGILRERLKIDWKCEGRVNIVDPEMLALMKRAGCSMIAYGVESASQKALDWLRKGTTPDMVRRAFAATRAAGIRTMAYFILGIPVETWEDSLRTIEFAREIGADYAQFSVLSPFPGTRMYEDAIANGWYAEVDAQNPMDKDRKRPVMLTEHWDERKLKEILRIAHRRFYMRPKVILREILSLRDFASLRSKIAAGLRLLRWSKG